MSHPSGKDHLLGAIAANIDDGAGDIAKALWNVFSSRNVMDSNGEAANVVDALARIASAIHSLALAVGDLREPDLPFDAPAPSADKVWIPDELRPPRRRAAANRNGSR